MFVNCFQTILTYKNLPICTYIYIYTYINSCSCHHTNNNYSDIEEDSSDGGPGVRHDCEWSITFIYPKYFISNLLNVSCHCAEVPDSEYAASNWSWSLLIYLCFSSGDKLSWITIAKVKLAIKPEYLTSVENALLVQLFFTLCYHSSSYFFCTCWSSQLVFSSKETANFVT